MTVGDWLAKIAVARGDAPAIVGVDRLPLSWTSLLDHVRSVGAVLHSIGVGAGDVVLIALPDGPDALSAILGAASIATAFPISEHEQPERYERLLSEVAVSAIICSERLRGELSSLAASRNITLFVATPDAKTAGHFRLTIAGAGSGATRKVVRDPSLDDPVILIATSGATSAAKIVSSSHASIFASITHCATWLSLSPDDRSLCVMPFAHLHSIVRSTLPGLISGGAVVCTPGLDRGRILNWIDRYRPTYMTAAPSIYRILLQRIAETGWRPAERSLRLLVAGSDSIDAATVAEIPRAFGAPLLQFYGLSEVAPLVAVTPADGTLLSQGAIGKINPAWSVVCVDETGAVVPAGAEGEIAVKGGFVNPLVGPSRGTQRRSADGYLLTGDVGTIDRDGFLFVTGRVDDRIYSGGRKIDPHTVEELLLQHPAVAQAAAFGIPDQVLGHRVAAVVVPRPDATITEPDLQVFLAGRAFSYMVPERIVITDEMPASTAGKVARSGLAERLGLTAGVIVPAVADHAGRRDDVEDKLAELFAQRLKLNHVDRSARFFQIGGDSFSAIELLFEVEDLFGVRIPPATFTNHSSVASLTAFIKNATRQVASRILPLQAEGRFPPLFVTYNVEGNVGYGGAITGVLGPEQPIYALHTVTSKNDAAEPQRLEEQAAPLVKCIRSVQPNGPYNLLGYSFGSHLALEIAQQIFDQGESVAFFGVIDDNTDLGRRQFGTERQPPAKLTTLSCNQWALRRYIPKPYPGRITLFRASEPADTYQSDPLAGWSDLALGGVEAHDIPGDHESVVRSEGFHWGPLLGLCLAKARHRTATLERRLEAEASKALRRARAMVTNKSSRHTIDARVAAKLGDRATEISEYRKALQIDPVQPLWVQRNLAEALIENGETDVGFARYETALTSDPWPFWSMVQLADLKRSLDRPAEIQPLYERARELVADDPDVLRHWGHLCSLAGKVDEAEAAIRRAITLEARKSYSHNYLGDLHGYLSDILASRGLMVEAIAAANEAVRLNPTDPKKLRRVANLISRATKPGKAPELADRDKRLASG